MNRTYAALYALTLLIATTWPAAAQEIDEEGLQYAKDAVVLVVTSFKGEDFIVTGSGFAISDDGTIVTNAHVVDGMLEDENGEPYEGEVESISVVFYSGTEDQAVYPAELIAVGSSELPLDQAASFTEIENYDLALLQIEADHELAYFDLGSAEDLVETEQVFAAGFPLGLATATREDLPEISVRTGSVSALRHNNDDEICVIEHSASLEHGNSGGPLINLDGEVVGVNTWTYGDNLNRAISADILLRFLEEVAGLEQEEADPEQ